jgi:uncharacterized protein (TIGR03437 family)
MQLSIRIPIFLFTALSASAQFNFDYSAPIISYRGVMNAASLTPPGLSGSEIAQGSIFSIAGQQLGPPILTQASSFPLLTTLAGVSVKVIQGTTSVNAFPLVVSASQVFAIMPSNAPLGQVSIQVTYNNDASNITPATVAANSFGIFSLSGSGFGPGTVQNFIAQNNQPVNSLTQTANPGQTVTLWGTGLGAIAGADNVEPTAGNLSTPVEIFVGGMLAPSTYSGRSSCCAGLDQIVFQLPEAVPQGCYVPVQVRTAGTTLSNAVTMAISGDGNTCSDPGNAIAPLFAAGGTVGAAILSRSMLRTDVDTNQPTDVSMDQALISLQDAPGSGLFFNSALSAPPLGTCTMYSVSGRTPTPNLPDFSGGLGNGLDAGPAIAISGRSQASLNRSPLLPFYAGYLGTDDPYFGASTLVFNESGPTTISGTGGTGVEKFQIAVPPAVQVNWLNRLQIGIIDRTQPLTVTWSPGGLENTTMAIGASNYDLLTNTTQTLICTADPAAGSFVVPSYILGAFLPSSTAFGRSHGVLGLAAVPAQGLTKFTASGLDAGIAVQIITSAKTVLFQ